jgi:hypothetical protein
LPTAISAFPERAERTLTAISGALVPKETTVNPITRCETPMNVASLEAPRTNASAPAMSNPRPIKKKRIAAMSIIRPFRQKGYEIINSFRSLKKQRSLLPIP